MKTNFEPSKGQGQLSDEQKSSLAATINRAFAEKGMPPV